MSKEMYPAVDSAGGRLGIQCAGKPKVVFVCVHNSCRSQIAEALGRKLASDVAVFMGGNVSCPNLAGQYAENWGLDDPSGQSDEVFLDTIRKIEEKVIQLKRKLS